MNASVENNLDRRMARLVADIPVPQSEILELVSRRTAALQHLLGKPPVRSATPPDQRLMIARKKERFEYYQIGAGKDGGNTPEYIPVHQIAKVQELANASYRYAILQSASKELRKLERLQTLQKVAPFETIYEQLRAGRKELVSSVIPTEENLLRVFLSEPAEQLPFSPDAPEYYLKNGVRVRSKAELFEGNELVDEGIAFLYEIRIYLSGFGYVHPDFTVFNRRTKKVLYWEHFGKMDDPAYAEKALRKLGAYQRNGYFPGEQLILTFETAGSPLNTRQIQELVRHYFL